MGTNMTLSLLKQKIVYYSRATKKFSEKNKSKQKESISFAAQQFKNLTERRLRIPIKLFHL